jgi:predicted RND superfamily exporter protein
MRDATKFSLIAGVGIIAAFVVGVTLVVAALALIDPGAVRCLRRRRRSADRRQSIHRRPKAFPLEANPGKIIAAATRGYPTLDSIYW